MISEFHTELTMTQPCNLTVDQLLNNGRRDVVDECPFCHIPVGLHNAQQPNQAKSSELNVKRTDQLYEALKNASEESGTYTLSNNLLFPVDRQKSKYEGSTYPKGPPRVMGFV